MSFFEIAKELELTKNQMQCLRRSLKGWEREGLIVIVGTAKDGSYAWTKAPDAQDELGMVATGAAHAAEVYLDRHQVGERKLDIPATASAIYEALVGAQNKQESMT